MNERFTIKNPEVYAVFFHSCGWIDTIAIYQREASARSAVTRLTNKPHIGFYKVEKVPFVGLVVS